MTALLQDLRHAVRRLGKSPGFAATAVATIGLGIGASTLMFSVVDGVLLRPLPYPEPDRLVVLESTKVSAGRAGYNVSYPDYVDWRDQSRAFEGMAALRGSGATLTGVGAQPERVEAGAVTASFFEVLRTRPALGGPFPPSADRPGGERVVVLSDALWRRRYAADPGIVGRSVALSGTPYTVVGVLPAGARLPGELEGAELLTPVALDGESLTYRGSRYLSVIARLRPQVSLAEAEAEVAAIASRLARQYPDDNANRGVVITSLQEAAVGPLRGPLLLLLAAVGFVLLIACTNVANLMLPRALVRRREIAVRAALGAPRRRLVAQLLVESLLIALLGGVLGVVLASWGLDSVLRFAPRQTPHLGQVGIDGRVLAFGLVASVVTGLLFGIAPALSAVKVDLVRSLHGSGRTTGLGRHGASRALVVTEVALSLVLLAGAGLSLESFRRLLAVHPGFDPAGVLTFKLSLPESRYPRGEQRARFIAELLDRIRALPGVEGAGAITPLPLGGDNIATTFLVLDRPAPPAGQKPSSDYRAVTPGYLEAMRIPLKKGRAFDERDRRGAAAVALVNETLVARLFSGEEPLGRKLRIGVGAEEGEPKVFEIVGVVGDVRNKGLHVPPRPEIYVPLAQHGWAWMSVVVRAPGGFEGLPAALRREVAALDPEQAMYLVQPLGELLSEAIAVQRFVMGLLSGFAILALFLAAIGLYGVLAGSVSQRTAEIGVRIAVGADAADVMRMVLGQAARLAGAGVLIGLAAALALTRLMRGLLYEVSATDPPTFAAVGLTLLAVSLLASYLPARRAARVDPVTALRCE
jgi:putative ABC transport system permease protein